MKKSKQSLKNDFLTPLSFGVSKILLFAIPIITIVLLVVSVFGSEFLLKSNSPLYYSIFSQHAFFEESTKEFANCIILSIHETEDVLMLLSSAFWGLYQFRFLNKRALASTLLSFGESRKRIFNTKTVFSLSILIIPLIIVKCVALFANYRYLGLIPELLPCFFSNLLFLIEHCIFGFSIGALSRMLCGRSIEAYLLTIGLLFSIKGAYFALDLISSEFLYGFSGLYSDINSQEVFFLDPTMQLYGESCSPYTFVDLDVGDTVPPTVSIIHSFFWIIVSIALLYFGKRYFSFKFKVEKAGFKAANPFITVLTAVTLPFSLIFVSEFYLSVSLAYYYEINTVVKLTVALLLLSLFTYILITLSVKPTKEFLASILTPCVLVLLTIVITATGGLGYKNRIPDAEKIESITVFSLASHIPTPVTNDFANNFSPHNEARYFANTRFTQNYIELTSVNDFEIVRSLHKTALDSTNEETLAGFRVWYTLKNGKAIERQYNLVSEEVSEKTLSLFETDAVKKVYREYLTNAEHYKDMTSPTGDVGNIRLMNIDHFIDSAFISLYSKDNSRVVIDNLLNTSINRIDIGKEIKTALYNDIKNMTVADWHTPKTTYGTIAFSETYRENYDANLYNHATEDDANYDSSSFYSEIDTHDYPPDLPEALYFPLTDKMPQTLKVLEKYDLLKHLENKKEIKTVYLADTEEFMKRFVYVEGIYTPTNEALTCHMPYFDSYSSNIASITFDEKNYKTTILKEIVTEVTDVNEYKKLLNKSHTKYYIGKGGKLLISNYTDGTYSVSIIP